MAMSGAQKRKLASQLREKAEGNLPADARELLSRASSQHTAEDVRKALDIGDEETDMTALMLAASEGFTECVEVLLEYGASTNIAAEESGGRTALHMAAYGCHRDSVHQEAKGAL
eukprot:TRINITY_DN30599_c0_g1_i4.p2 TRINITY_DN30599_c0_g1~~TRINITY_DN30599_c0_g1_i4.p2  ORF type:complete len:115 (-),score=25.78 TRINITY_DN30599_c0_g1_i4:32-376(-)